MIQKSAQFEVSEDNFDFGIEVSESSPVEIVEMAAGPMPVPSARCN